MTPQKDIDIAIVGGGIAGLTLAIALHHRGVPFTLYEQAPAFGEIGAGVSFTPSAVQAMKCCHDGIYAAFEKVCTRNEWESKQKLWFDYHDGYNTPPGHSFPISNSLGQRGVHRAEFLDQLVNLIPQHVARFNKVLTSISDAANGKLVMEFLDGTTAEADAIIGCDGIKSRVRQELFPTSNPSYSHKYAYRGLIPMNKAIEAVGNENAQNACMYMGPGGHVLTFPVKSGTVMNVVAFHTSEEEWEDSERNVRTATRADALHDFAGYGEDVNKILQLMDDKLNVWAIFDLYDNPVPSFYQGRVCISGDAAHATSPHHGAGAGFCIEDSAILAALLSHESVNSPADIELAFAVFDECRRERGQWLVESSRFIGDCYEWRAEGVGSDFSKIENEINARNSIISDVDVVEMCQQAKGTLSRKCSSLTREISANM
ncbi:unnamed protein product [Clonostachys byssicola]|uniref:FAD-binding domain-containing protein n=1 Tax=Clonostachys byssicola TaxID=160290 RepID=A0A9N9Y225_9HYPO|nr:unnamed protein product [Clonostachys byssicola]